MSVFAFINKEWSETVKVKLGTASPVLRIYLRQLETSDMFTLQRTDRIPFIFTFTRGMNLQMDISNRQFSRVVSNETILEIYKNATIPVKVQTRSGIFIVGKGILLTENLKVLICTTVTNEFYDNFRSENGISDVEIEESFTIVVNEEFLEPGYKSLYKLFKEELETVHCDILYTRNPRKNMFVNIKFPRFRSIQHKQTYINEVVVEHLRTVIGIQ